MARPRRRQPLPSTACTTSPPGSLGTPVRPDTDDAPFDPSTQLDPAMRLRNDGHPPRHRLPCTLPALVRWHDRLLYYARRPPCWQRAMAWASPWGSLGGGPSLLHGSACRLCCSSLGRSLLLPSRGALAWTQTSKESQRPPKKGLSLGSVEPPAGVHGQQGGWRGAGMDSRRRGERRQGSAAVSERACLPACLPAASAEQTQYPLAASARLPACLSIDLHTRPPSS
jgi:hypothetical protein